MSTKYKIWNKTDTIYTYGPPFKFSPAEWSAKYPWSEFTDCVISGEGVVNGAFCMPLDEMVSHAEKEGCDFSSCVSSEDKLNAIEAFEEAREAEAKAKAAEKEAEEAQNSIVTADALASIAASMEYQNMMTLEDVEE